MATNEDKQNKSRLKQLMTRLGEAIQDYLDNIDIEEADEKKAKKEKK